MRVVRRREVAVVVVTLLAAADVAKDVALDTVTVPVVESVGSLDEMMPSDESLAETVHDDSKNDGSVFGEGLLSRKCKSILTARSPPPPPLLTPATASSVSSSARREPWPKGGVNDKRGEEPPLLTHASTTASAGLSMDWYPLLGCRGVLGVPFMMMMMIR
jgi:hypothetical protein